jgi:hypothetical protein
MDADLTGMCRDDLQKEVEKLRAGIRAHRDSTGHNVCWYHPELWSLLPEAVEANPQVPPKDELLTYCQKFWESCHASGKAVGLFWTDERPTVEGWYWKRPKEWIEGFSGCGMIEVRRLHRSHPAFYSHWNRDKPNEEPLIAYLFGTDRIWSLSWLDKSYFYGPLPEPRFENAQEKTPVTKVE